MNTSIVSCRSVSDRHFRRRILHELTFDFSSGVLGVMGPNGAGKSTLFRILGEGLRYEGAVELGGHDLRARDGRRFSRSDVGYQPQQPAFVRHFSVRENVEYAAWLKNISPREFRQAVNEALAAMSLEPLSTSRAAVLSGGEAKRLSIAMAVVHRPRLLILDEPTAALDLAEHDRMLLCIQNIMPFSAVVLSSHDASDISAVCTDVLVLSEGRSRFHGSMVRFTDDGSLSAADAYRRVLSS